MFTIYNIANDLHVGSCLTRLIRELFTYTPRAKRNVQNQPMGNVRRGVIAVDGCGCLTTCAAGGNFKK